MAEQLFLMFGQVARNGDIISYYQIAKFAFFLVNRKAFVLSTDFGSVLGFRFYFQFYLAVQCVHGFFTTQYGGVEAKRSMDI